MLDDVDAADQGLTTRGDDTGGQDADRRGLAGAIRTEQPGQLACPNLQVEPVDGTEVRPRIGLGETKGLDDGCPVSGRGTFERRGGGGRGHGYCCTVSGGSLSGLSPSRASVLGQDLVQLLASLLNHADTALDLRLLAVAGQLLRRAHELPYAEAQRAHPVVGLAGLLPGQLCLFGFRLSC